MKGVSLRSEVFVYVLGSFYPVVKVLNLPQNSKFIKLENLKERNIIRIFYLKVPFLN